MCVCISAWISRWQYNTSSTFVLKELIICLSQEQLEYGQDNLIFGRAWHEQLIVRIEPLRPLFKHSKGQSGVLKVTWPLRSLCHGLLNSIQWIRVTAHSKPVPLLKPWPLSLCWGAIDVYYSPRWLGFFIEKTCENLCVDFQLPYFD